MAKERLTLNSLLSLAREIPKENWEYYYLCSDAAEKFRHEIGAREVFKGKNRLDKIGNFYDYTDWDYRGFIGRANQGNIKIIQSLRNIHTLYGGDRYPDDKIEAKGSSGGDEFLLSANLKRKCYPSKRFDSPKPTESELYWTPLVGDNYWSLKRRVEKEYGLVQKLFQIPYQIFLKRSLLNLNTCPCCGKIPGEEEDKEVISVPLRGIDDY